MAVPTYYLTREDEEHEADEECDDKELDVELLHEREEVPTIKVSAIRPPGALRKNERALDRMMHALRRRGVRSTLQATQLCRGPRGWGPRAPAHLACPLRCAIHRPCLLRERESTSQHRGCADSDEPRSPDGFNHRALILRFGRASMSRAMWPSTFCSSCIFRMGSAFSKRSFARRACKQLIGHSPHRRAGAHGHWGQRLSSTWRRLD